MKFNLWPACAVRLNGLYAIQLKVARGWISRHMSLDFPSFSHIVQACVIFYIKAKQIQTDIEVMLLAKNS